MKKGGGATSGTTVYPDVGTAAGEEMEEAGEGPVEAEATAEEAVSS